MQAALVCGNLAAVDRGDSVTIERSGSTLMLLVYAVLELYCMTSFILYTVYQHVISMCDCRVTFYLLTYFT